MSDVKVTLQRSKNKATKKQKACLASLGLRKIRQSRVLKDSPALRGQVNVVKHLVSLESASASQKAKK